MILVVGTDQIKRIRWNNKPNQVPRSRFHAESKYQAALGFTIRLCLVMYSEVLKDIVSSTLIMRLHHR